MKKIDNPFASFWMAGFECSDQLNTHGDRVDFLHITSHLELIGSDYGRIAERGMKTVREGIRWSQIERVPYQYDFSTVERMIAAGQQAGIQQIWDICHFGYPDDLTPLHPHFTRRFEALCTAFALFYKKLENTRPLIVTPVNEVGFISWLGGEVGGTAPFCRHNGWEVKYALMRAYIAGIKALKAVDPEVRILTTEPLVHVTAPTGASEQQLEEAAWHHELQFQVLEMLSGRICPELGGEESYLDLLGFNYYYDNQWMLNPHRILGWRDEVPDENLKPLSELLISVYERYDRPIVLSETSHPGVDRPLWIEHISEEVAEVLRAGIPFWGICIYPIIDRPDWDNLSNWHHSGIWDCESQLPDDLRILHQPSADALASAQQMLAPAIEQNANRAAYEINPETVHEISPVFV